MKRLHTSYEYHDSVLTAVRWPEERILQLQFQLDASLNSGFSGPMVIEVYGVRNRKVVEAALRKIVSSMTHDRWLAEVVAIVRHSKGSYLVDTTQGELIIEGRSLVEK